MSPKNKMNTKKKVLHHTTGSCGYTGKEETWQDQEEKVIQLGATPATANWTEWSKRFILGHGVVLTAEGRLEFKTDKVNEVAEMIEKAHVELEEGTFVPFRDLDELNYALQSKEHPGCTCGYGNRPWKQALKSTADSYGKKRTWWVIWRQDTRKGAEHFVGWDRKDAWAISVAYTRTDARIGAITITTIIGPTRKCFGLAQPWWAS
jgi:hypothetical protein